MLLFDLCHFYQEGAKFGTADLSQYCYDGYYMNNKQHTQHSNKFWNIINKRGYRYYNENYLEYRSLTLSARHPFQNFSTPCILKVNNTGAKQRSIMK
jgi:hypothetical protein